MAGYRWFRVLGVVVCCVLVATSCSFLGGSSDEGGADGSVPVAGEEVEPEVDIAPPEVTLTASDDGGGEFTWEPVDGATGYEFRFDGASSPLGDALCTDVCRIGLAPSIARTLSEVEVLVASRTEAGSGPTSKVDTSSFEPVSVDPVEYEEAPLTIVVVFEAEGPPESPRVESSIPKPSEQRNIQVKTIPVETVEEGQALIEEYSRKPGVISVEFGATGAIDSAKLSQYQTAQPTGVQITSPGQQLGLDFWPNKGAGVTVAVIDGGVNPNHPGLAGVTVLPGANFDGGPDGVSNPSDHGTAVASVIAGQDPLDGFAPEVTILPVDIHDTVPCCWTPGRLAEAMIWSVDNGADVISMSVTVPCVFTYGPGDDQQVCAGRKTLQAAVDYATEAGVPVVTSAGNRGDDSVLGILEENTGGVPAILPDTIAVGSVDRNGELSDFSTEGTFVDVLAPGELIPVAVGDDRFIYNNGTSFAQPIIASLVAVIRAENPNLTPAEISAAFGFCGGDRQRVRPDCVLRQLGLPYGADGPDLAALGTPQEMFVQIKVKTSWEHHPRLGNKEQSRLPQSLKASSDGFRESAETLPGMSTTSEGYFGAQGRGPNEFIYNTYAYSEWKKTCVFAWDEYRYNANIDGEGSRSLVVGEISSKIPVVIEGRYDDETGLVEATISKGLGATTTERGTLPRLEILEANGPGNCSAEDEVETGSVWSQAIIDGLESYLDLFPISTGELELDSEPSGRKCGETVIDDLIYVKVCGAKSR